VKCPCKAEHTHTVNGLVVVTIDSCFRRHDSFSRRGEKALNCFIALHFHTWCSGSGIDHSLLQVDIVVQD
jgi:hypothetical protein